MYQSFKFRAYPTARQKRIINQQLMVCEKIGERLRSIYKEGKRKPTVYDLIKKLPGLKRELRCAGFINAQVLQEFTKRVHREVSQDPRVVPLAGNSTLTFPQWGRGVRFKDDGVYMDKIGVVKYKKHREMKGTPKTLTLKMTSPNVYHIIWTCVIEEPKSKTKVRGVAREVGIDFGCMNFLSLSTGEQIPMPKEFWKTRREYRALKRSGKQKMADRVKARLYDFCDNLVRETVKYLLTYWDCFYVEDVTKTHMNGSVTFVPWRRCINLLKQECRKNKLDFVLVEPHNTSRECSHCGFVKKKIPLSERDFLCESCGLSLDRDTNAAKVILQRGKRTLMPAGG